MAHIHTVSNHGDPLIHEKVGIILAEVSVPFFSILSQWIFEGELNDPFLEFFVTDMKPKKFVANDQDDLFSVVSAPIDIDKRDTKADNFELNQQLIPPFIPQILARKIYIVGKSINFLRYQCKDMKWLEKERREREDVSEEDKIMTYEKIKDGLEELVDIEYRKTSSRVIDVLNRKFKLKKHLHMLRKFLLLGQGDFIRHLMDSIS